MASSDESGSAVRDFLQQEAGVDVGDGEEGGASASENGRRAVRQAYGRPNGQEHLGRPVPANEAGVKDDVELLRRLRAEGMFCQLIGPPGTGKTSSVEAAFGEELITVVCSEGTDEDALTGGYRPDPETQWKRVEGAVVIALREGKVLYLDEIGALHPRVSSKLNGVFDGRLEVTLDQFDGETVNAAEGFYCVVSYNPGPEFRLSEAMHSRFGFVVRVGTDLETAKRLGVPKKAVKIAERIYTLEAAGEASWAPQLRELVNYRRAAEVFGEPWAVRALIGAAPEEATEQMIDVCGEVFKGDAFKLKPLEL